MCPPNQLELLIHNYALAPLVVLESFDVNGNNPSGRVHTGTGDLFVRNYRSPSYDEPASISYENQLLAWLSARSLSFVVPVPIHNRDGALVSVGLGGCVALTPWLPGERLDPTCDAQVELLGEATGELQSILQNYPRTPRPGCPLFNTLFDFPQHTHNPDTLGKHLNYLPVPPRLLAFWDEESDRLKEFMRSQYRQLPVQPCHNDVTHNNVLVDRGRVSAVLDFEFATVAPCALDLVQGLRATMRILDNPHPIDAACHSLRGYIRWRALTEAEIAVLPISHAVARRHYCSLVYRTHLA